MSARTRTHRSCRSTRSTAPPPSTPTCSSRPSRRRPRPPTCSPCCADLPAVFEVVYDPWPTPLAQAALDDGRHLVAGLDLLAHQAVGQVQRMTGRPVSVDLLREAGRSWSAGLCRSTPTAPSPLAFAHGLARTRPPAGRGGLPGGVRAPRLVRAPMIARIPEPEPEPQAPDAGASSRGASGPTPAASEPQLFARTLPPPPDKAPYADIAAAPRLSVWTAAWSGLVGAALRRGARVDRCADLPGAARARRRRPDRSSTGAPRCCRRGSSTRRTRCWRC